MITNNALKATGFLQFEDLMDDGGLCSLFIDRSPSHDIPFFIWLSDFSWDHVIASYSDRFFTPMEIELLKRFFFTPEEHDRVEVIHALPDEPRPYGIHLWLQKAECDRPEPLDFIPSRVRNAPWTLKMNHMYSMAILLQCTANSITPDEYVDLTEKEISRLFSDNTPLSKEDRLLKLSFYKKPSVEKFFVARIKRAEGAPVPSYLRIPSQKAEFPGGDSWKTQFDPLLHNAVILQANGNHVSPQAYTDHIANHIDKNYSGKKPMDDFFSVHFAEKPSVQSVFLKIQLEKENMASAQRGK